MTSREETILEKAEIHDEGFTVRLSEDGPWLKLAGSWTPDFAAAGHWSKPEDAELALRQYLGMGPK